MALAELGGAGVSECCRRIEVFLVSGSLTLRSFTSGLNPAKHTTERVVEKVPSGVAD